MKIFLSGQNAPKMANLVTGLTDLTDFGAFPGLRSTNLIFTHEIDSFDLPDFQDPPDRS